MNRLRASVTHRWDAWFWSLLRPDGFIDHASLRGYPTASLAADAARRELAIRTNPDPIARTLMRAGVLRIPTRSDYTQAN